MATIVDDYVIVGASSDNFDCDSTNGWSKGGNAKDATTMGNRIEGAKALGLQTSDKDESWWYHNISADNRFKITEKDLGLWFYYVKGKGDNFLVQDSTAIVVRLYFGGYDKYADYRLTAQGDLSLKFGWQMLMCSGTELNGGSVGGGHNGDSDFNLDVYRFEFRLNCANKVDVDLGLDAIFIGTTLEVQSGTANDPVTVSDLKDYTFNTRSGFPIGTVDVINTLVDIKSGIKITNNGYVLATNKYLLFNQLSSEVHHRVDIIDGTFHIGDNISGTTTNGCQIVKPEGKSADFIVSSTGTLKIYNSKFYRWDKLIFRGVVEIVDVDIDTCDVVQLYSDNINFSNLAVHNSVNNSSIYAIEIDALLEKADSLMVYRCTNGTLFLEDSELIHPKFLDNTDYDISISEGKTATLDNAVYATIRRV